jgi:hypothetical protein
VDTMLMRTDPFRDLDRLTQQVFGTNGTLARPSVMPMDACPASPRTRSTSMSNATWLPSRLSARLGPATPS